MLSRREFVALAVVGASSLQAFGSGSRIVLNLDDFGLEDEVNTPLYAADVDIIVSGATKGARLAFTRINGGRNVILLGGAYRNAVMLDRFSVSGLVEGVYVKFPPGLERDAISLRPAANSRKLARPYGGTRATIRNCRCENIQGHRSGVHGDAFQLAGSLNAPPEFVVIDGFTATCGYQGLFLSPQTTNLSLTTDHEQGTFSATDGPTPKECRIRRCNLRKTSRFIPNSNHENISLFSPIDTTSAKNGNRVYPKFLDDFWVSPFAEESILECLAKGGIDRKANIDSRPIADSSGQFATYHTGMLIFDKSGSSPGRVNRGVPQGGDFVSYSAEMIGGIGRPGIGYKSP
ncbi:hypothetical protein [Rhizobium sp. 007]|uniref:hypothetical protein n=1 Tax=Rhizobium sp. 007 TaxID=2785056 RepID=UPI0018909FDA|nr:hypothetical protein [Rhizobium sp. 007]QPB22383.1 hypothetical protein ISN39_22405 [Rhizobium sp. 007]